ncbi:HNH endonuclease signature motif containing protein [Pseudomonas japonica]|uniref:HNH endonuclease signature motif containing protein n=1 Tax=Pseudomonas japonica TaxID=256466 RepID=UPI00382B798D
MISYPRTPAELAAFLANGYDAALDLIRQQKARVNIVQFLRAYLKKPANPGVLPQANRKLLSWFKDRQASGKPDAAIVYHCSGVRMLNGFTIAEVTYTRKANRAQYRRERKDFNKIKPVWIRDVAVNRRQELLDAGLTAAQVDAMAKDGKPPSGYQLHHRLPLDDGGTNDAQNLILMRNDVEHRAVHGRYNPGENLIHKTSHGQTVSVAMPIPPQGAVIYPDPSRQWVAERVPSLDLYEIYQ